MNSNRNLRLAVGLAALVLSSAASAVQVLEKEGLKVDVGLRFKFMGELQHTDTYNKNTAATMQRDATRIYLFQSENRLSINAELDGIKVKFEEAMGGEDLPGSNNNYSLLELNAEVPVMTGLTLMAGQFRRPDNLGSASYEGNYIFSTRSYLNNLFFNQGFDVGMALIAKAGLFDALLGTGTGSPTIPQRYLPIVFELPPPIFLRAGIGNLPDDPFRFMPLQNEVTETQWGLHVNGSYCNDSKVGHSTLLSQNSAEFDKPSVNFYYGNAMLNNAFNPLLGKTSVNNGPVDATYWTSSLDAVYRLPVGEKSHLVMQASWAVSQYINNNSGLVYYEGVTTAAAKAAGEAAPGANTARQGQVTVQGGEIVVGLEGETFGIAGRADVILPDPMIGRVTGSGTVADPYLFNSYFNSDPIYEVTFPSLSAKINQYVKVTADTMFWFNAPEVMGDIGIYEVLDEPTQVSGSSRNKDPNSPKNNPVVHKAVVPMGRVVLQVAF